MVESSYQALFLTRLEETILLLLLLLLLLLVAWHKYNKEKEMTSIAGN